MDLLEKALRISPQNAACRFYRARLLFDMHEYEECCEELNDLKMYAHDEAQVCFSGKLLTVAIYSYDNIVRVAHILLTFL